jgi:hypothetical protein
VLYCLKEESLVRSACNSGKHTVLQKKEGEVWKKEERRKEEREEKVDMKEIKARMTDTDTDTVDDTDTETDTDTDTVDDTDTETDTDNDTARRREEGENRLCCAEAQDWSVVFVRCFC